MTVKWNFDARKESAHLFKAGAGWSTRDLRGYRAAQRKDIINERPTLASNNDGETQHKGTCNGRKWTLESCKERAKEYTTQRDWQTGDNKIFCNSYMTAWLKGWLAECCDHMATESE